MQHLLRWTPAAAALSAAALLTINSFRTDRPRADEPAPECYASTAEHSDARRRIDFKVEVVADLVAGRISATEAHARFLDANRAELRALEYLRYGLPGGTDEERTAYQLILFVRGFRHPRAREVAAAVGRELLVESDPLRWPQATRGPRNE